MEGSQVRRIPPEARADGPPTPGMARSQALATERMWAGTARTDPEMVSAWHHHGDHESAIYVLSGALRMEFGRNGSETFDAGPGDFVMVAGFPGKTERLLPYAEVKALLEPDAKVEIEATAVLP